MKYYKVDYKGNLKQITRQQYLKDMEKDIFVAYEDKEYTLVSDSANSEQVLKNAILQMLQARIYFDV